MPEFMFLRSLTIDCHSIFKIFFKIQICIFFFFIIFPSLKTLIENNARQIYHVEKKATNFFLRSETVKYSYSYFKKGKKNDSWRSLDTNEPGDLPKIA